MVPDMATKYLINEDDGAFQDVLPSTPRCLQFVDFAQLGEN
jgi:hypothetical protein